MSWRLLTLFVTIFYLFFSFDAQSLFAIEEFQTKEKEQNSDLLKSIFSDLNQIPKIISSEPIDEKEALSDRREIATTNPPPRTVNIVKSLPGRKPSVELGFGTGWDYATGDDEVGSLDISTLSRAYVEGYARWWGPLTILGPDFGAEAYYFTPTMYWPKICGNNPCSDVLDIRINYLSTAILYRLVRPSLTIIPLVGYLLYNFNIPNSQQFVVDHAFQGVSLGARIEFPLKYKISFMGSGIASVGDYSEEGRTSGTPGKLLHATALHADAGFRWQYKKGLYFDVVWQNDSFWYDFKKGSASSFYWNIGGRIVIALPFISI